ncbi:MAG TPA: folate-binding protein [Caulobacteraceae bacterium]
MSSKVARLARRGLVGVSGPDAASFLQGLLTCDVEGLAPGALRFGALLTPQGKFLFDLFVAHSGDSLILDVEAERRDAFIQRLSLYRLRAKVEIAAIDGGVWARWGADKHAASPWMQDPRLPALGGRAYGDEVESETASEDDYDAWRLSLGVPDPARDCEVDRSFLIEADFDLLHGIDFQKGCFVGQETTSRMKRRGQIRSRTVPITFEGPPPAQGAEILAGDLRAGEVLSGREGRALALVRLDRVENAELTVDGRSVRVEFPEWMTER